jgi:hypothetical protein
MQPQKIPSKLPACQPIQPPSQLTPSLRTSKPSISPEVNSLSVGAIIGISAGIMVIVFILGIIGGAVIFGKLSLAALFFSKSSLMNRKKLTAVTPINYNDDDFTDLDLIAIRIPESNCEEKE